MHTFADHTVYNSSKKRVASCEYNILVGIIINY